MSFEVTHIAFDLDDTLIDTQAYIVPPAKKAGYEAFHAQGLKVSQIEFENDYDEFMRNCPRENFWTDYAEKHNLPSPQTARNAFYNAEIKPPLRAFAEVPTMLDRLKEKYVIYLVTMGYPKRQTKKIQLAGLTQYFKQVWIVEKGMTKGEAFQEILDIESIEPTRLLCVGNRMDSEISEANKLGCVTCLVHHGEYFHQQPANDFEKADYELDHIRELTEKLPLLRKG